jgi:membrane protease YdiL (CAAX protease family)
MAAGIPMRTPDGSISLLVVAVPTLVDTVVSAALVIAFLRNRGERPGTVLLGHRPVGGEALVGLALVPVVFVSVAAMSAIVQQLAPWMHDVPQNPLADLMKTPWSAAMMGFIAVVGGGVREELQRGFILHRFEQHLGGRVVGLLVFSILFGLGHAEVQGWDAAVYTGTLGFIWGVVYLTRGSIIAPMVSHALFNAVQVIGQLVQG